MKTKTKKIDTFLKGYLEEKKTIVEKELIWRRVVHDGRHQGVNVREIQVAIKVQIPTQMIVVDQRHDQLEMGADTTAIDVGNCQLDGLVYFA